MGSIRHLSNITAQAAMLMAALIGMTACSEAVDIEKTYNSGTETAGEMAPPAGTASDVLELPLTASSPAERTDTASTRAADGLYEAATGFDGTEQVTVYLKNGATTTQATYDVGTPYAETEGGKTLMKSNLTAATGQTAHALPTGTSGTIELYGIYPATSTTTHTVSEDQTTDASYKASDLMYARATVGWNSLEEKAALATTNKPNLPFEHQMVKLRVVLVKMSDVNRVTRVELQNVKRQVTVAANESNMTVGTATSSGATTILLSSGETAAEGKASAYTYCCLFPVQAWGSGSTPADFLKIGADGYTTTYRLLRTNWVAGNEYTLTINLNDLALGSTIDIEGWTDAASKEVTPTTTSAGALKMETVGSVTYNGAAYKPTPAVSYKGTALTSGTDFDYQYYGNVNAGTAVILAVGKTGTQYEGQVGSAQFTISPRSISATDIAASVAAVTYNRSQQTGTPTVTDTGLSAGGTVTLSQGTDYTVSGNKQTNAGSYTVTFTGTGNYTGTRTATWTVNPKSLTTASGDFTITLDPTSRTYNGSKQSVSVSSVTDRNGSTTATMTASTDYTVSGTESTSADVGTYTVTVTGKGNYTGTKTATWTITKTAASVTTAPTAKTLTYNGSAQELVNAGTASGGTMYYCMTTTNVKPNVSNLTSTSIPTATNAGTYYVWYYVKGDANHTDTDVLGPVTVTIQKKTVTDWSISPTTKEIKPGDTFTITVSYGSGSTSDHGTVSWSSSATGKATVSDGTVTAVAAGSATITVTIADGSNYTYSGSKTCDVTVKSASKKGTVIQDPDNSNRIKVYTSDNGGYTISKSNTNSSVSWSYNASWGSKDQWTAIFNALGGTGYSVLNTAVANAGISGWTNMSGNCWSCTEYNSYRAWYFHANGWDYDGKSHELSVRSVSAFTD